MNKDTNNLPIYTIYTLTPSERLLYSVIYEAILMVFSYLFYDSFYFALLGNIFIKKYFHYVKEQLKNKQQNLILRQFIDMITAMSASLSTGYSLENSLIESKQTIINMYGDNSILSREIQLMERQLILGIPIESLFDDLSARTGIEDIRSFCDILNISKRTGGNIIDIIRSTSKHFKDAYNIRSEISTSVAGKKYEQLIMFMMPLFIIIYINITQPGFFIPLYHNLLGIINQKNTKYRGVTI